MERRKRGSAANMQHRGVGCAMAGLRRRRTDHRDSAGDRNCGPANNHGDPFAHVHRDPAAQQYGGSRCDTRNDADANSHLDTLPYSGTHGYGHSNADCCANSNSNRNTSAHAHDQADQYAQAD